MKSRVNFWFRYILFWILFFYFARLLFLLYELPMSLKIEAKDWFLVFFYGTKIDLSMVGYTVLLPTCFLIFSNRIKQKFIRLCFDIYTFILLISFGLIVVADLELYRNWGFRMDSTPLLYISKPLIAAGNISIPIYIVLFLIFVISFTIWWSIYAKFVRRYVNKIDSKNQITIPVFIFLTALLFIPIRGGLGVASMNVGYAYYNKTNNFANHAAINVVWNVGYSLTKAGKIKTYNFLPKIEAQSLFNQLYIDSGVTQKVIKNIRPNIILVVLESFTAKLVEATGGLKNITPNLNALSNEGILFTNFYASSDRTDKALVAILNAQPSLPTTSIIKFPDKTQRLLFLTKDLAKAGYNCSFYYGGDIDFANMHSLLTMAQFDEIISKDDFPANQRNSKWGVHDQYVFERVLKDCDTARNPFFKMFMTLSSHEPFEIPGHTVDKKADEVTNFIYAVKYTDSCLGEFVAKAKTTGWWKNSLILFVADHGHRLPGNSWTEEIIKYHIPFVCVGGALVVQSLKVSKISSQTDIAKTLLSQLEIKSNNTYSKNIFSPASKSFAFFDFNNGFGFISDSTQYIYDINLQHVITKKKINDNDLKIGKAYLQVVSDDFVQK